MYNTLESVIESMFLEATVDIMNEEYEFEPLQESSLTDAKFKAAKKEMEFKLHNLDKYIKINDTKKLKSIRKTLVSFIELCDKTERKPRISKDSYKQVQTGYSIANGGVLVSGVLSFATADPTMVSLLAIFVGTRLIISIVKDGYVTIPKKDVERAKTTAKKYISKIDAALEK